MVRIGKKVRIPEDEFVEEGYIKNRLYSRKWVPFMVQELEGEDAPSYLCFDFDPDEQEGIFGQLIGVSPAEKIEDCELDFIYPNIFQWANVMIGRNEERSIGILRGKRRPRVPLPRKL